MDIIKKIFTKGKIFGFVHLIYSVIIVIFMLYYRISEPSNDFDLPFLFYFFLIILVFLDYPLMILIGAIDKNIFQYNIYSFIPDCLLIIVLGSIMWIIIGCIIMYLSAKLFKIFQNRKRSSNNLVDTKRFLV